MYSDDRAVSITVGYVLNLAVASILISGLLVAGGGLIESQTKQVTADELAVAGQQLAEELSSADRLARAGESAVPSELSLESDLPARTASGGYSIEIEHADSEGTIELRSASPEVSVVIPFRSETDVESVAVDGGPVWIEFEYTSEQLVVEST
ncbi:MAG: DUF7266 family protein [Halobacteriota archaeon]|uniref:DUF7266 family protein n=1 Tax=Natronomonas sp. TaxID=2184060 RepID=UPI0039748924